jgi:hypothetical protein
MKLYAACVPKHLTINTGLPYLVTSEISTLDDGRVDPTMSYVATATIHVVLSTATCSLESKTRITFLRRNSLILSSLHPKQGPRNDLKAGKKAKSLSVRSFQGVEG